MLPLKEAWESQGFPLVSTFSPNVASDRLILNNGTWRSTDGGH